MKHLGHPVCILLCAALSAQDRDASLAEPSAFPLALDTRWTYVHDGEVAMILDIAGTRSFGGKLTKQLRIRGGSLFWSSHSILVTGDAGLVQHTSTYFDEAFDDEQPSVLLPARLERDHRWSSGDFRAHVVDREKVTVPAGTFRAWKIEYVLGGHLGSEHDLRIWVTPEIGIVKFSKWRESVRGNKSDILREMVWELSRFGAPGAIAAPPWPRLTGAEHARANELVDELVRGTDPENTTKHLVEIGHGALSVLHRGLADRSLDHRARARLEAVVVRIPKLVLEGSAATDIAVGESPAIEFRLRNFTRDVIDVLPSLDGSDSGMRRPAYHIDITGPDGELVDIPLGAICATTNPVFALDFVRLRPGEALDPFGPGSFGHYKLKKWKPDAPGVYEIRLTLDSTGDVPGAWTGGEFGGDKLEDAILRRIEAMPRGRFVSNTVRIRVR